VYCAHFGLQRLPFAITPDTSFAYSSRAQREALNTLLLTTDAAEGFVKITGEVGSGKTLLCRRFLAALAAANGDGRRFRTAYLPNPCLSPRALLRAIGAELKVRLPAPGADDQLLESLNRALLRLAGRGEQVVLCLDEAQAMPPETLESLRLLSNLETEQRKLLQIVLFGQPELDVLLAAGRLRPLRSRIAFEFRLGPLALDETADYLAHRLRAAGHDGPAMFSAAAVRCIHAGARGLPRRINILAHKALLVAYGQGAAGVEARHARAARADARQDGAVADSLASLRRSALGAWHRLLDGTGPVLRSLAWARAHPPS
jgi:MSHA biogenesis protein MshM